MSRIEAKVWGKRLVFVVGLLALITLWRSCFEPLIGSAQREFPSISSPSSEYEVFATIEDVSLIYLHLTNKDGVELDSVYSHASDAMKWALGWMPDDDVVVLQSSDIGTTAYDIIDNHLVARPEAFKNKLIQARANELKFEKYGGNREIDVSVTYDKTIIFDSDGNVMDTCVSDVPGEECLTQPVQPD